MVLYLDIDDTVLQTDLYLKRVLEMEGIPLSRSDFSYRYVGKYDDLLEYGLSDYTKIPFISGAKGCISSLSRVYDKVVFVSCYTYEREKFAKEVWAKLIGVPLILCNGNKHLLDMHDGVLVDDRSDTLVRSNAIFKYNFYNKWNTLPSDIPYLSGIYKNWYTLSKELASLQDGGFQRKGLVIAGGY